MKRSRRKFTSALKTRVVLEALKERETIQQIASRFEVHPNQISQWKRQFIEGADTVFEDSPTKAL
jgi:transposase-like protein